MPDRKMLMLQGIEPSSKVPARVGQFAGIRAMMIALGCLVIFAAAIPARAVLTIQAQSSSATAGGTGTFNIVLNDSGGTFEVGGFSIQPTLSGPTGINFTAVSTNTISPPYIFGTYQSAPSPFSFDTFPNTEFSASDTDFSSPGAVMVSTGSNYGLASVSYSVAAGTPAGTMETVSFVPAGTSVSDLNGGSITFTPVSGTITVTPEPASLSLAGILMGTILLRRTRKNCPA